MSIYEMPNITDGFDNAVVGLATTVPPFTPMLLVFVFFTVLLGGITSQKRRNGFADIPMWAVISSMSTLLIALPMTMVDGIIDVTTLSIVVVVTILSGFWLFTSRSRNEV